MFAIPAPETTSTETLLPAGSTPTICSSGSGPYRRIKTQAGVLSTASGQQLQKYGYSLATIALSDGSFTVTNFGALHFTQSPTLQETPYVLLGGTSGSGTEVDAGLQVNATSQTWGAYVKVGTGAPVIQTQQFGINEQITLEFYMISNNNAQLKINNGTPIGIATPGFFLDGHNNRLKRVQSIAQKVKNAQGNFVDATRTNTGAFYSVDWLQAKLGQSKTSGFHDWGMFAGDLLENCRAPDNTHILLGALGGSSEEEVTIDLR
jgi:hypothetical protein